MHDAIRLLRGCAAGFTALALAPAYAQTEPPTGWQLEVTPYMWASGMSGTVGLQGVEADVDADFEDIFENLDSAFMGTIELRRGRLALLFDGLYFNLADQNSTDISGPFGVQTATVDAEVTSTMQVYQLAGGYRLGERVTVDLIAGARYTQLETEIELDVTTPGIVFPGGSRSADGDESWWDPIVGAVLTVPFGGRWAGVLYGDFGGFGVGSDSTYQVIAGIRWQFSKHFSAKAGYRYVYQDYENDDDFVWDIAAYGPYLGLGIRF